MSADACDRCAAPPVVWQRYASAHLCAVHLRESVERRAHQEMGRQARLPRGVRLLVAYSGGKDSTVALHLMADLRAARPDVELVAVTVDEGIAGYRPPALEISRRVCAGLGVEHLVRRTRDRLGLTIDEAHARDPASGACGVCGVYRRRLLNDAAKDVAADALVTGHNLDDAAQSVLMNLTTANVAGLARLAPHETAKPGLVPRVLPLRTVPESEVYLYATVRGLTWHDDECPYAAQALRGVYRDVLYRLEEARPGTRHALLRLHEELRLTLLPGGDGGTPRACPVCGEPSAGETCRACELRRRLAALAPSA